MVATPPDDDRRSMTEAGLSPTVTVAEGTGAPLLQAMANLSRFHRDHEKFYAPAPREQAVASQRHARTLQALADRWSTVAPGYPRRSARSKVRKTSTILRRSSSTVCCSWRVRAEPAEITRLKRDLRETAEDSSATGEWLVAAMQGSWEVGPPCSISGTR